MAVNLLIINKIKIHSEEMQKGEAEDTGREMKILKQGHFSVFHTETSESLTDSDCKQYSFMRRHRVVRLIFNAWATWVRLP